MRIISDIKSENEIKDTYNEKKKKNCEIKMALSHIL